MTKITDTKLSALQILIVQEKLVVTIPAYIPMVKMVKYSNGGCHLIFAFQIPMVKMVKYSNGGCHLIFAVQNLG